MFVELFFGFLFFVGIVSVIENNKPKKVYVVVQHEDKPKYIHNNVRRPRNENRDSNKTREIQTKRLSDTDL